MATDVESVDEAGIFSADLRIGRGTAGSVIGAAICDFEKGIYIAVSARVAFAVCSFRVSVMNLLGVLKLGVDGAKVSALRPICIGDCGDDRARSGEILSTLGSFADDNEAIEDPVVNPLLDCGTRMIDLNSELGTEVGAECLESFDFPAEADVASEILSLE